MKGRNAKPKKREISLLAKTIKSLKEDSEENEFHNLKNGLYPKTYDKNLKFNSSLKIFAYNQKKFFPNNERNSKNIIY
jgi:hypothetical protein